MRLTSATKGSGRREEQGVGLRKQSSCLWLLFFSEHGAGAGARARGGEGEDYGSFSASSVVNPHNFFLVKDLEILQHCVHFSKKTPAILFL